ncbi:MAG TPA: PTS sugar transporter subunit IIA [Bacteroidetes bacterium]|nr:PTS sugar transporter subunit IIA [Bacteroidota bacterium]
MKLTDLLNENLIKIPLEKREKEEIIGELIDILVANDLVNNRDVIFKAVMEREKVMSTGVGDGVAIPHGKADGITDVVAAFGISKEEIDFQSIDERPVHLVFLLVASPDATGPHLKALSRVSRLLNKQEFREKLIQVNSAAEVMDLIRDEEKIYFEI